MSARSLSAPAIPSDEQRLPRAELEALQMRRFREMAASMLDRNRFYRDKFAAAGVDPRRVASIADLRRLPFTTKAEIVNDQALHPPYGSNLSEAPGRYVRMHQTSGTTGAPIRWLDTRESWAWFMKCWSVIYGAAGVRADDRLFFPFSFGPFIGFWAAFEGAQARGHFCLAGGGMSTPARLRLILDHAITFVCCTPTYALRMAQVAAQEKIDLRGCSVRGLIVAGEPGGHVPGVRRRIEDAWGARVFDHTGMTEIGSLGFECVDAPDGTHLMENECIAEVIDSRTLEPAPPGAEGELVLTNLGRWGSPLIRYRTGDRVRLDPAPCACGRTFSRMQGGILGRVDDMIFIKGNNVYPSAVESIIREERAVEEFRLRVRQADGLHELRIEIELQPDAADQATAAAQRLRDAIRDRLFFQPDVAIVAPGSLPRFEMKARRLIFEDGLA